MGVTNSIQFFGRDKVLEAYEYADIETWSIFQQKQFITAGAGVEQLDQFLQMLEPSGSAAAYTLKVYRDIDNPQKITDKTECHGSFNFRLTSKPEQPNTVSGAVVRSVGVADAVSAKIAAIVTSEVNDTLERRFNNVDADDEKAETISDIVIGYLKEPEKLLPLLGALRGLFTPVAGAVMPAAMAGIEPAVKRAGALGAMPAVSQDEQQARLVNVLNRLEEKDPKILQHLEALANLAEKNPALFNMLLMQLDSGV